MIDKVMKRFIESGPEKLREHIEMLNNQTMLLEQREFLHTSVPYAGVKTQARFMSVLSLPYSLNYSVKLAEEWY